MAKIARESGVDAPIVSSSNLAWSLEFSIKNSHKSGMANKDFFSKNKKLVLKLGLSRLNQSWKSLLQDRHFGPVLKLGFSSQPSWLMAIGLVGYQHSRFYPIYASREQMHPIYKSKIESWLLANHLIMQSITIPFFCRENK